MKVLYYCHVPFMLAHGGAEVQIEQSKAALEKIGVDVEPLRWWDDAQTGDVLQHFGRLPTDTLLGAQRKGMKVVLWEFLTEAGSRSPARLKVQKTVQRLLSRALPASLTAAFNWQSYLLADACIASTSWEAHLITELFGAPRQRIHVVPNGVEQLFFDSPPAQRGPWLVCTATIVERKRVLELAEAAVEAKAPVWVIGKPYSESDPYARRFMALARQHSQILRYEGAIADRVKLAQAYRQARGFVLLSTIETLSLSAVEAAACECPLLLSDLPWARAAFGQGASYCPIASTSQSAAVLSKFYQAAPTLTPPPKPMSWIEVAQQLKGVYESLLKNGAGC